MQEKNKLSEIDEMARKLMKLARDTITVRFRFFDVALANIKGITEYGINGVVLDKNCFYYDPVFLLKKYMEEPGFVVRMYLHIMLHCIFLHLYKTNIKDYKLWHIAADIAVENVILEFDIKDARLSRDSEQKKILDEIKKNVDIITAERLYRHFIDSDIDDKNLDLYEKTFSIESRFSGKTKKESQLTISQNEWEKIATRVKTDISTFSKKLNHSESLEKNIIQGVREKVDYRRLLENFMVVGEEMCVSDEEFDYVYYTYGLSTYENMPLIEPLEYKEVKKVKEFVIAIDTSASCKGEKVKNFLRKTYRILKDCDSFFNKVNVHIIQCDFAVRSDVLIDCNEKLEDFIQNGKLTGFGATDFRPVFTYVEELKVKGAFENLKGLIYFTDGYGIYPEKMPDYEVVFAFLDDRLMEYQVPEWAVKVVWEEDMDEY